MDEEKNEKSELNEQSGKIRKPGRFRLRITAGKRIRIAGAVYMALAVCVVTVMVLSIYSVSVTVPEDPGVSLPEISRPKLDLNGGAGNSAGTVSEEIPVSHEQSSVPAETSGEPTVITVEFYKPVKGSILKGYRMTSLVYSSTLKDYRTHSGVDIAGKVGDPVVCYSDGVVKDVRNDPFMGVTVEIEHEYGLVSVYQNLAAELASGIKAGVRVSGGSVIGAIGETAVAECADEPHLHFELLLDGKYIDVEKELKRIK